MSGPTLSLRALSRATLERQLLLRRAQMPALGAIRELVGMQAQIPRNPYLGLWSRLDWFSPDELSRLLEERKVVRTVLMRGTLHLVTADDCLELRPLVQPVLDRELARHRDHAPHLDGVDLQPVLAFARDLLKHPRTLPQLRLALQTRFPEHDAAALAYACRNLLALVQVPPRGMWGASAGIRVATAEAWIGRPLATSRSLDDVVLRYLAAFGPATAADVATWSGLAGQREVLERLRPRLRTFRDPAGRELFDVPDGPLPDPDTPAPVRFLPEYDNVLLSHADRSRFVAEEDRRRLFDEPRSTRGTVLCDGAVLGPWTLEEAPAGLRLVVHHLPPLPERVAAAVAEEGRLVLRFLHPDEAATDVRFDGR